jgi:hypothetical protein
MRRGFFRLWIVASVLWISLVGWSWRETFQASFANKCWASVYAWRPPAHEPKLEHLQNDWDGPYPNDNECWVMGEYPREFVLVALAHVASLPGGLLAFWLVAAWIGRGFYAPKNDRRQQSF